MNNGPKKPLLHCTLRDINDNSRRVAIERSIRVRKYSVGLLEEAYKLSRKEGSKKASIISGININSLNHYTTVRNRELGILKPKSGKRKISDEDMQKCSDLALKFMQRGMTSKKSFIEAGKIVGINGRSVEFSIGRGIWVPKSKS